MDERRNIDRLSFTMLFIFDMATGDKFILNQRNIAAEESLRLVAEFKWFIRFAF